MPKLPWFKFNPSLWKGDTELSMCTPATRGIWIDLLCAMHQSDRSGVLSGTTDQIARLGRCSTVELNHALTELQATGTADVTFRNNNVTVVNRLMKREAKARKDTALRVMKHRRNGQCNTDETGKSKEYKNKESKGSAPSLSESNLFRQPNIPTLDQVKEVFFRQGGTTEQAEKFFQKHEATGWFFNNSPIKNFANLVPGYLSAWRKNDSTRVQTGSPTTNTPPLKKL